MYVRLIKVDTIPLSEKSQSLEKLMRVNSQRGSMC